MRRGRGLWVFPVIFMAVLAMLAHDSLQAAQPKKGGKTVERVDQRDTWSIPSGTDIIVSTDQEIIMRYARVGDVFPATVDRDVVVGNDLLLRRGERAEIRLFRVEGRADEVAFRLISITESQKVYNVNSDLAREYTEKQSDGLGTLGKVAIGAATGAAIGAVAGGGRGAAIGAAAGAGGGLIWSAATMQNARVPAGTRLRFSLAQPVYLD